jgi:serine/threonine-protein kinase
MPVTRRPDERVAGSYVIVRALGVTALGAHYLARAPDGGAVVYREALLDSPSDWRALERFEATARLLHGLEHPRIARILAWARSPGDQGPSYSVEQAVDGDPLTVKLLGWRPTEADARRMAHDLLDALVYLQQLSPPIWHQCIDPSRVVCARDGSFHLTDFVAASTPNDDRGPFAGDPGFMAPEQGDGRSAGPPSASTDVYGVGATVLYALFRKPPTVLRRGRGRIREEGGARL